MNQLRSTRTLFTIILCALWLIIFVSLFTLYQSPTTQAQNAITPMPSLTAWPTTMAQLRRCSSLPTTTTNRTVHPHRFMTENKLANNPNSTSGANDQTRVEDAQTGELITTLPVIGTVSVNHCNNRILISAGARGIYIFDGKTYGQVGHIPYVMTERPRIQDVDANTYAVRALDNAITDDYLIAIKSLHYAHGGYWSAEKIMFLDSATLALNNFVSDDYAMRRTFDPTNAIYDPATNLFYTTTACCGDSLYTSVSAWTPDWKLVREFIGIGGQAKPLWLLDRRLYVQQGRWIVALDVETFSIAATHPCCALPDTGTIPTLTYLVNGSKPDGWFYHIVASPTYATDHMLYVITSTGLYRSTDGGARWSRLLESTDPMTLYFSPTYAADKTLIVSLRITKPSNSEGLLRTTDGGTTWQPINTGLRGLHVTDLIFSSDHIYASVWNAGGLTYRQSWMKSDNQGERWQPAQTPPDPTTSPAQTTLATCGSGDAAGVVEPSGTFAVSTAASGYNQDRLYKLQATGCWAELPLPLCGAVHSVMITIIAEADDTPVPYVLINHDGQKSGTLYTSDDGGETWKMLIASEK